MWHPELVEIRGRAEPQRTSSKDSRQTVAPELFKARNCLWCTILGQILAWLSMWSFIHSFIIFFIYQRSSDVSWGNIFLPNGSNWEQEPCFWAISSTALMAAWCQGCNKSIMFQLPPERQYREKGLQRVGGKKPPQRAGHKGESETCKETGEIWYWLEKGNTVSFLVGFSGLWV